MSLFTHLLILGLFFWGLKRASSVVTQKAFDLTSLSEQTSAPNKMISSSPEKQKKLRTQLKQKLAQDSQLSPHTNESEKSASQASSEENSYFDVLKHKISAQLRYPENARKRLQEATIEVEFELDQQGNLIRNMVISPGRMPLLENAALEAVKNASPFLSPPPGISHVFRLPLIYEIAK